MKSIAANKRTADSLTGEALKTFTERLEKTRLKWSGPEVDVHGDLISKTMSIP